MEISEIIKNKDDRLFIVDPECFLIYTGETQDEKKTFLRIGTWLNMPAEIIPLIEHIIITDKIIGDPSHEQFNINLKEMKMTKYIGSNEIIKKFFNFQSAFSLDFSEVSILDIEKDLPEILEGKILSEKNEFIGIFLKNGNFKVIFNNNDIIDLHGIEKISLNYNALTERIHDLNKENNRYNGSGLVIAGLNPIIYNNNLFSSIYFPLNGLSIMHDLCIDPERIESIIFPSENYINLTGFLKWKDYKSGSIKIFTDSHHSLLKITSLFPKCKIIKSNFNKMNFKNSTGMIIKNYSRSNNIKFTINSGSLSQKFSGALIYDKKNINDIMKDDIDIIIIMFSVYETVNLIFKSWVKPLAIIDDGNNNIKKINPLESIILYSGFQYSFEIHDDINKIEDDIYGYKNLSQGVFENIDFNIDEWMDNIFSTHNDSGDYELYVQLFNLLSNIRIIFNNTHNRELAARLKVIIQKITSRINLTIINNNKLKLRVILFFYNQSLYQFFSILDRQINKDMTYILDILDGREVNNQKQTILQDYLPPDFILRIINDRRRLAKLLNLNTERKNNEFLRSDINNRKEQVKNGIKSAANYNKTIKSRIPGDNNTKNRSSLTKSLEIKKISLIMIIFIVALSLFYSIINRGLIQNSAAYKLGEMDQIKKYKIHIDDKDVFKYAQNIALKNNYARITTSKIKNKNPDWIYPGNIFYMHDGERVVVKKGDTLWDLTKNKLIKINILFYELLEKFNQSKDNKEKLEYLDKMKETAITENIQKILKAKSGEMHEIDKR